MRLLNLRAAAALALSTSGAACGHTSPRTESEPDARTIPGIRYVFVATGDTGPSPGLLTPVSGAVEFAAGRGRVDVFRADAGPTVRIKGVDVGPPLAMAGDYYLFDSTGYIVVRPKTKTFMSFSYNVASSYNYNNGRDGWPGEVSFGEAFRADTIGPADGLAHAKPRQVPIYWHMEFYHDRQHHLPVGSSPRVG
jgi:hypothetical protein